MGRHIIQAEVLFPRQRPRRWSPGCLEPLQHGLRPLGLFLERAEFRNTGIPFGMFRQQPDQKTGNRIETTYSLVDSAHKLLDQAHYMPADTREALRVDLLAYREEYPELLWRKRDRLARMGEPPPIAMRIRRVKARLAGLIQGKA